MVVMILKVRYHILCLVFSALLLGLCYPPIGWGWMAHLALAPAALLALCTGRVHRLVWTSWIVWWLWWLIMIRWLWPVTGAGYALLAAWMAVFWPATLLVFRVLVCRLRLPAMIALPMALVSFELWRGHVPQGGFGWFMLGHSQAPWQPSDGVSYLIQMADIFGELGISFLVAMTNGMVVDILNRPWYRPTAARARRLGGASAGILFVWAGTLAVALAYGACRIHEQGALADAITIAVIQTNVPQSNKDSPSLTQQDGDWQNLLSLTHRAAEQQPRPQLIVWPETVVRAPINAEALAEFLSRAAFWQTLTDQDIAQSPIADKLRQKAKILEIPFEQLPSYMVRYYQRLAQYPDEISRLAVQLDAAMLIGAPTETFGLKKMRSNSVYLYRRTGRRTAQHYDKIHRVPFGEYLPWVESWPWLKRMFIQYISPYAFDYTLTPGKRLQVFGIEHAGQQFRLLTPICFEDVDSRLCRRMFYGTHGVKRGDILLNLTNDGWFSPSQRTQHLQIAVFRSIENRVPSARSVNTGVSGFISSVGRVGPIAPIGYPIRTNQKGERFVNYQVAIDERSTMYGRVGQMPIVIMAGLTAMATLVPIMRRKHRRLKKGSST